MRLKDVVYSMPFLALGFAGWRHADWVVSSANSGVDGTCAGIEELLSRGLAIAFWLLSVAVFLFGILFRSLKRFLEDEGPSCGGSVFGECDPDRI